MEYIKSWGLSLLTALGFIQPITEVRSLDAAFPAISTAIFGYDINEATPIAIGAVRDFLKEHPNFFDEIIFVIFSDNDLAVYKKYILKIFK